MKKKRITPVLMSAVCISMLGNSGIAYAEDFSVTETYVLQLEQFAADDEEAENAGSDSYEESISDEVLPSETDGEEAETQEAVLAADYIEEAVEDTEGDLLEESSVTDDFETMAEISEEEEALEEESVPVHGTCGESLEWNLDEAGVLTISGSGDMDNYELASDYVADLSDNPAPWYQLKDRIVKVEVLEGVTGIGAYAFSDCKMEEVVLPSSLTSLGGSAFRNCDGLKQIVIPEHVAYVGSVDDQGVKEPLFAFDEKDISLEIYLIGDAPQGLLLSESYPGVKIIYPEANETYTDAVKLELSGLKESDEENSDATEEDTVVLELDLAAAGSDSLSGIWKENSVGKWYQYTDGSYPKNCWVEIDGYCYHFDASGYMQTGWLNLNGAWYFLESDGKMAVSKWIYGTYYMKESGVMAKEEWVCDDQYYVDSDGKWVKGRVKKGWKENSIGKWYVYEDGSYPKDSWVKIDDYWYYFNTSGYMHTGWLNLNGTWYFLESDGKMAASKWIYGTYYVKESGAMAKDEWVCDEQYYVDKDGKWVKGKVKPSWKENSVGKWYVHEDGSYPKDCWEKIDGYWYHFNASGYMQTGWLNLNGTWYYLESDGKMAANKWIYGIYYVKASGAMAVDEWVCDDKYYVDKDGKWVPDKHKETEINGVIYDVVDEKMTVTGYNGTSSSVVVEPEVNGMAVTVIGEEAFYQNTTITYVDLPDCVEVIGVRAFAGCSNLSKMD